MVFFNKENKPVYYNFQADFVTPVRPEGLPLGEEDRQRDLDDRALVIPLVSAPCLSPPLPHLAAPAPTLVGTVPIAGQVPLVQPDEIPPHPWQNHRARRLSEVTPPSHTHTCS
jgi:hypothetical protein